MDLQPPTVIPIERAKCRGGCVLFQEKPPIAIYISIWSSDSHFSQLVEKLSQLWQTNQLEINRIERTRADSCSYTEYIITPSDVQEPTDSTNPANPN